MISNLCAVTISFITFPFKALSYHFTFNCHLGSLVIDLQILQNPLAIPQTVYENTLQNRNHC